MHIHHNPIINYEVLYTILPLIKIVRNDALYQYMVYLPEIKMTNRITSRNDMNLNSSYEFKIYVFRDEARLKHKIRLEILNAYV